MKKLFAIVLVLGMLLCAACAKDDGKFTQKDAQAVAIAALGVDEKDVSAVHVHVTEYQNTPCYSFHITVDGHAYEVIVSATGEVLHKGESSH